MNHKKVGFYAKDMGPKHLFTLRKAGNLVNTLTE